MRIHMMTLVALLLASVTSLAAAQEPVTRAYDARALTLAIDDDAGPRLGFPLDGGGGGDVFEDDSDMPLTVDALIELIQANVDPELWEGRYRVQSRGGAVLVTAPEATHTKVASLIAFLRAKHIRTVSLEVAVYRGDAAAYDRLVAGGSTLDAARREALASSWKRVRRGRVRAFSGQTVHLARVVRRRLLYGLDSEVARGQRAYDPDVRTLLLGHVAELRPVLADDGKALLVECAHGRADTGADNTAEMPQFSTGVTATSGARIGALDQPRVARRDLRTSVWLPAGGSGIVGSSSDGERVWVTVVRHVPRAVKLPEAPRAEGRRVLQLIDARYATFRAEDFVSPRIIGSGAPAGAAFSEDVEEGAELSIEALSELIRDNVDEDSWHNARNRIGWVAGKLAIRQTPDTARATTDYVRALEHARSVSVMVRAKLFKVAADEAADELAGIDGPLSAEQRRKLDAAIAAGESMSLVDDLSIAALPAQRVYSANLVEQPIVANYGVEIAHTASAREPEVRMLRWGTVLDVRPTLVQATGSVVLDLRLDRVDLDRIRTKDVGEGAMVQLPDLSQSDRRVNLVLPEGGSGLVDLGDGRYALVEVHVSRVKREERDKRD